jgi:4a-hydroxytetrahydrobiopterin dehydratase
MWEEKNNALHQKFEFKDFDKAMQFMQECIVPINAINHHPEWSNVYNTVTIKLTTHDEGNTITPKDRKLAAEIDQVYCQYQ